MKSLKLLFRKLFNLSKEDDVRQYVIKRPLPVKEGKKAKSVVRRSSKVLVSI